MTKTDARNITTSYSYDALNRVVLRDYSNSTPDVSYFYDGTGLSSVPVNSKGVLTKVSSSVSETRYTDFDALGRLTSNQQITDRVTYPISYSYNLAGALVSETYPSGRVVTNQFDKIGRLTNVSSNASGQTSRTYANGFTYNAAGAVSSLRLGNGRYESTTFNSRLQPTQIALGTSANNTSLLKLNYTYGVRDGQGNLDAKKNNGNVESQTITVSGMSNPFVQSYTYDSLNRITSATETSNGAQTWKQTYQFDRYGNRRFDTTNNNTTTLPSGYDPNVFNPTFNTANNRMSDNQGYEYDSAGNVTKDAANKRFAYDAENKQTSFGTNGSTTNGGTYFYDGDGKRIKKIVGTETTIFVYNASGQLVAEYTATAPQNPTISYLTSDTLGTPRINTDANGQVTARHDYMPFGEEIFNFGGRNSQAGIDAKYQQNDNIRQKFTGYERDDETSLDYAQARYYSSQFGRFSSTDPLMASGRSEMPQSWNRYVYVLNNPLKLIDPSGLSDTNAEPQTDPKITVPTDPKPTPAENYVIIAEYQVVNLNNQTINGTDGKPLTTKDGKEIRYGFGVIIRYQLKVGSENTSGVGSDPVATEELKQEVKEAPKNIIVDPSKEDSAQKLDDQSTFVDIIGLFADKPISQGVVTETTQTLNITASFEGSKEKYAVRKNLITINTTQRSVVIKDITNYTQE